MAENNNFPSSLFMRQANSAIDKNKAFKFREFNPMAKYDDSRFGLTEGYQLSGGIIKNTTSVNNTKSSGDDEDTSGLSENFLSKYLADLDKTTRTGHIVDAGLAAANLPFLFQKRKHYPKIITPRVHAAQMRNDTALYKSIAKDALSTVDLSNRKLLSEAGQPSLYSTANLNRSLQELDRTAYERNRQVSEANAQLASQAEAANVNTAIQADAAQREGQFKMDELIRQTRMQSFGNILNYGSSIAGRETSKSALVLNAMYADKYKNNTLWGNLGFNRSYNTNSSQVRYDKDGNIIG